MAASDVSKPIPPAMSASSERVLALMPPAPAEIEMPLTFQKWLLGRTSLS
jgi:hypothetical protein